MKIFCTRKQLLAFFMPGFLAGIFFVNFIAKKYIAEPGIFSEYFLTRYETTVIIPEEYLIYLLRLRIAPMLMLAGLSLTKMRKAAAVLFLFWTGISGGILISTAVLNMGIQGSIFCLIALFPQFLAYIPAYLVLIWYCYSYPQNRWNRQKTVFIILMLSMGIALEIYVNPLLMKAFLAVI